MKFLKLLLVMHFTFYSERYDEANISPVGSSGHVTSNVWGWIHLHGVGELARLEGRFNAEKYLEILEEVMLPSGRAYALPYPERILFMQDNCSIHTANIMKCWFQEQPSVELLPWSSKSCDLNPIENVWGNIVQAWEPEMERNSENLYEHATREWERMRRRPDVIHKHVASVPRRLQDVIQKEGGWTRY